MFKILQPRWNVFTWLGILSWGSFAVWSNLPRWFDAHNSHVTTVVGRYVSGAGSVSEFSVKSFRQIPTQPEARFCIGYPGAYFQCWVFRTGRGQSRTDYSQMLRNSILAMLTIACFAYASESMGPVRITHLLVLTLAVALNIAHVDDQLFYLTTLVIYLIPVPIAIGVAFFRHSKTGCYGSSRLRSVVPILGTISNSLPLATICGWKCLSLVLSLAALIRLPSRL